MFNRFKDFFVVHPPVPFEAQERPAVADRTAEVMREAWRRAQSGAELLDFYRSVGFDCVVPSV